MPPTPATQTPTLMIFPSNIKGTVSFIAMSATAPYPESLLFFPRSGKTDFASRLLDK